MSSSGFNLFDPGKPISFGNWTNFVFGNADENANRIPSPVALFWIFVSAQILTPVLAVAAQFAASSLSLAGYLNSDVSWVVQVIAWQPFYFLVVIIVIWLAWHRSGSWKGFNYSMLLLFAQFFIVIGWLAYTEVVFLAYSLIAVAPQFFVVWLFYWFYSRVSGIQIVAANDMPDYRPPTIATFLLFTAGVALVLGARNVLRVFLPEELGDIIPPEFQMMEVLGLCSLALFALTWTLMAVAWQFRSLKWLIIAVVVCVLIEVAMGAFLDMVFYSVQVGIDEEAISGVVLRGTWHQAVSSAADQVLCICAFAVMTRCGYLITNTRRVQMRPSASA